MATNSTAVGALKQGLELEQKGLDFYRSAEERTADPLGKVMFQQLARDEANHYATLKKQMDALESGGGWVVDTGSAEKPEGPFEPLFPPDKAAMQAKISQRASDVDALHFALELENNAYNLYREAAESVSDPAGKAIYEYLAGLERGHFNLLMLNYDNLANAGRFLGAQA
jgi:rubrerythrin